jgi:hypothetical protein
LYEIHNHCSLTAALIVLQLVRKGVAMRRCFFLILVVALLVGVVVIALYAVSLSRNGSTESAQLLAFTRVIDYCAARPRAGESGEACRARVRSGDAYVACHAASPADDRAFFDCLDGAG